MHPGMLPIVRRTDAAATFDGAGAMPMKPDLGRNEDRVLDDHELELASGGGVFDNLRAVAKAIKEGLDHLTDPFKKNRDTGAS